MTDCIIVGGGLIGMLSARELTRRGMKVVLLEKGEMGQESSWAGGGILSPLHPWRYSDKVNELAQIGHHQYAVLADELLQEGGVDPEYIRNGMLVLGSDEVNAARQWAQRWSMRLEEIGSTQALQALSPGVSAQFEHGLWLPDVGQMRNPRLVRSLRASLDALGIEYHQHTPVEKLLLEQGRVHGVVASGRSWHAERVLIAGGAWSAKLLQTCCEAPQISPVKGQMILFKGEPGLLQHILLAENRYLIPRRDGRIVCGSTLEYSGFDKHTSEAVKTELMASAQDIFPALRELTVEHHWAGLRPGSPEGEPYIGEYNGVQGLYINAGHYRNGVILGLGSAQRIAQIMTD